MPEYDPLRLRLLRTHHKAAAAGHPGRSKTLELLKRTYFWPRMQRDVDKELKNVFFFSLTNVSLAKHGLKRLEGSSYLPKTIVGLVQGN